MDTPTLLQATEVLDAFAALPPGQSLDCHSPVAPEALQAALQAQWPGQFGWSVLKAEAGDWQVRITRRAAGKSCCGCCGG